MEITLQNVYKCDHCGKKQFRKGDIITGEIKTVKGKPSFVLHKGVMVIPFSCVRQIITKEIQVNSNATGEMTWCRSFKLWRNILSESSESWPVYSAVLAN